MSRAIEVLLIIGILINLIKGADLILRPYQQKRIQDKFETWVLWFDYTKPFDWYMDKDRVEKLFWIQYVLITPTILSLLLLLPFIIAFGWKLWKLLTVVSLITLAYLIYTIASAFSALKRGKPLSRTPGHILYLIPVPMLELRLTNWLFGGRTYKQHLSRHLTVVAIAFTLAILYFTLRRILLLSMLNLDVTFWVSFMLDFYINVFLVFSLTSLFILFLSLFFFIMELLLKVVRAIFWRIVEYNKGAFAAITLLITVVLGLAEFYLKYGKK